MYELAELTDTERFNYGTPTAKFLAEFPSGVPINETRHLYPDWDLHDSLLNTLVIFEHERTLASPFVVMLRLPESITRECREICAGKS